ncbi:hypothetical protein NDU88_007342, partial [Pleurodeles waltl]
VQTSKAVLDFQRLNRHQISVMMHIPRGQLTPSDRVHPSMLAILMNSYNSAAFLKPLPPFETSKKQNISNRWTAWIETFEDFIDALEETDNRMIIKYLKNLASDG